MNVRIPQLSKNQKAMLNAEIQKYAEEKKLRDSKRLDAMLLLMMHRKFGFGMQRLTEFHRDFIKTFNEFEKNYQDDGAEIAIIKLREETGIEIDELYESEGLN